MGIDLVVGEEALRGQSWRFFSPDLELESPAPYHDFFAAWYCYCELLWADLVADCGGKGFGAGFGPGACVDTFCDHRPSVFPGRLLPQGRERAFTDGGHEPGHFFLIGQSLRVSGKC